MEKELYTIHEAVMLTGRSDASIRHLIKRHQIPCRKIGYSLLLEKATVERLLRDR
jgi:hypothetical protein